MFPAVVLFSSRTADSLSRGWSHKRSAPCRVCSSSLQANLCAAPGSTAACVCECCAHCSAHCATWAAGDAASRDCYKTLFIELCAEVSVVVVVSSSHSWLPTAIGCYCQSFAIISGFSSYCRNVWSSLDKTKYHLKTLETVVSLRAIRSNKRLSKLEENEMDYFVLGKRFHLIISDRSV